MARKKGSSLLETRRRNRVLIKNMIFQTENATRTAIADELGLTLPTITTSVNEMLEEGILEEIPLKEDQLTNNMGRRPNAIAFRGDAAYVIGVELGPYATRSVLMDLNGKVIASTEYEQAAEKYEGMLDKVTRIILELAEEAKGKNLIGVAVGLPGFIDRENGIVRSNMRRDWIGRNLVEDLQQRLQMPVSIDNNVRIRAVGYEMSRKGDKPDSFAYLFISKGVACPIMLKEDVVSGYSAGAGEIGHMIMRSGDNGDEELDMLGSERAIFEKCQEAMLAGRLQRLKALLQETGHLTIEQILMVQEEGDEEINSIITSAIDWLGIALANVVNLINPGYVVVDSCIFKSDKNRRQLIDSAKKRFFGLNEEEVRIVFADFDPFLGAKGAGALVIRERFLDC